MVFLNWIFIWSPSLIPNHDTVMSILASTKTNIHKTVTMQLYLNTTGAIFTPPKVESQLEVVNDSCNVGTIHIDIHRQTHTHGHTINIHIVRVKPCTIVALYEDSPIFTVSYWCPRQHEHKLMATKHNRPSVTYTH